VRNPSAPCQRPGSLAGLPCPQDERACDAGAFDFEVLSSLAGKSNPRRKFPKSMPSTEILEISDDVLEHSRILVNTVTLAKAYAALPYLMCALKTCMWTGSLTCGKLCLSRSPAQPSAYIETKIPDICLHDSF
jgi:hypothetical protein